MSRVDIRAWREARGLSRRNAGVLLGLNPRTLEGLETGRAPRSAAWTPAKRIIALLSRVEELQAQVTALTALRDALRDALRGAGGADVK